MNFHPLLECSNNGNCDRSTGACVCNAGYEGLACERRSCLGNPICSGRGRCLPLQRLAFTEEALPLSSHSVVYEDLNITSHNTWDKVFVQSCVCDSSWDVGLKANQIQLAEFFGPACEYRRCPSGDDPLTLYVNETNCENISQTNGVDTGAAGNICHIDCSNRGKCDYNTGICACLLGFGGSNCGTILKFQ
jgi:hypothetical protein